MAAAVATIDAIISDGLCDKARDLVPVLRELVLWSARHVPGVTRPTPAQLRLFATAARCVT